MYNHVSVHVRDLEKSAHFYDQILRHIGAARDEPRKFSDTWHYRIKGREDFFCVRAPGPEMAVGSGHICFTAPNKEAVDAFFSACSALGGTGLGPPNTFDGNHYTALASDLDGNKIEAVHIG